MLKLAFVLLLAYVATASEHGSVLKLTRDNFEEKVGDGKVYFIKFFAPWCGHCKRLAPTWEELAKDLQDNSDVAIAHVDCTIHRDICTQAEVKGYPTLKAYHKGEEYKTYRGARDLETLKKFVLDAADELLKETTQ